MEGMMRVQPPQQKKKNVKKKNQLYNGDIVFSKNGSIQTIPSLNKRLKSVTDAVVGLHYVWEYRSPSKTVAPHYQCRLCKVQRLQNEITAHITGWRHCFKYLKNARPEKISYEEEEVGRNPALKKEIKVAASEVESAEGRGQIRIINREPSDVPAFQDMKSAFPSAGGSGPTSLLGQIPGGIYSSGSFGGSFMDSSFSEDFPPRGGMMSDFRGGSDDDRIMRSPGRYGNSGSDRMMGDPSMQRLCNNRSMFPSSDGFGMGLQSEAIGRSFSDHLMNSSDRMLRSKGQETNSNNLSTLLRCLDTFRIECEDDAQIVLKITQKLTDVLMEYRLRSVSSGPGMNSSLTPLRSNRFSDSMSGPSRFYN